MKTIEANTICPYAGLRSFTEEESLYFKGRDFQIDQIADLLEQNKFLMVTGASGEGKSSLIYAGLIPNMRAGFFKSHYTNWVVADFRPERSPLVNMTRAIADALGYEKHSVATELKRGYSSLIDLYVNSDYFIDDTDPTWTALNDSEKKAKKRNAANLVVIIDQFEEFFTNPENFSQEVVSQDSQIVVNLALETARIALKRNLPVYVVFTMRSDFIGQCVAFRGLPEYIGFSQFFVPRLKRKDFKQVIEEPAILSGNKISQRLIERLVYDIDEGVDQLPVLEHALSQIWLAANNGREEMDLIHYAMVGGMSKDDLPEDDQVRFATWFEMLPEFKRKYFTKPGLHKIIEGHASTLYESAWQYYNNKHAQQLTVSQSKRIVALAFSGLTKIDDSRAVRNRMTLGEITDIVNDPELTSEVVGDVLSIFREEGNSFIRPYISSDPTTHQLTRETVLDVTHEALIRNWDKLNTWAIKEFEFYSTWLDFKKQLHRWKESGKKSDYLLPIGPLTYFENWYNTCKPNVAWINRYSANSDNSSLLLADAKEFLKRSGRNVIVSRTFMKYGTYKVVTFVSIFLLLLFSGFYWNDAENKRNENVLTDVRAKAQRLIQSEEVSAREKATYLVVHERYESGSLIPYLEKVSNPRSRISIAIEAYQNLLVIDNYFDQPIKTQLVDYIEKEINQFAAAGKEDAFLLRQVNRYVILQVYDNYYNNPSKPFVNKTLVDLLHALVKKFYGDTRNFVPAISSEINFAVQIWLTFGNPKPQEISEMLATMSPFEGKGESIFKTYYPKGSYEQNGGKNLNYNGGYHLLASLYACVGDDQKVIQCFEKIKELTDYFVASSDARTFNNYTNIIGYLYQYDHRDKTKNLVEWISKNFSAATALTIYKNVLNRSGYLTRLFLVNMDKDAGRSGYSGYINMNLYCAPRSQFFQIADDYAKIIGAQSDPSEKHFLLATHYKRLAMFMHKYYFDRRLKADTSKLDSLLDEAWKNFQMVKRDYLEAFMPSLAIPYWVDGFRQPKVLRRHLFIYPDYMDGWFSLAYHSDLFFNYMKKHGLLEQFFQTDQDLWYVHFWLAKAYEVDPLKGRIHNNNYYSLSDQTLLAVAKLLIAKGSDANLPYILLANRSFAKSDILLALSYYKKIDFNSVKRSAERFEYIEKSFFFNQLKNLSRNLIDIGKESEANQIINHFEFGREKAFSYIFNAERIYSRSSNPKAFACLDSALGFMNKEDFTLLRGELDYRFNLITVLEKIGGERLNSIANEIQNDLFEDSKFRGVKSTVTGIAAEGNYFSAMSAIPTSLTETQELICCYSILLEACKRNQYANSISWLNMDQYFDWERDYVYYVPF